MKQFKLIVIGLLVYSSTALCQPLTWGWVQGLAGKSTSEGYIGLFRDSQGSTYITGDFTGSRTFGSFTLTTSGYNEVFVAKYNSSGIAQWAVKAGANFSNAYPGNITLSDNELYVTGKFTNTIICQGISQTALGQSDIFLLKLDPATGTCIWVERAGGSSSDFGVDVDTAASGGIYLCGSFAGAANFGLQTLNSGSGSNQDLFVAKYNSNGSCSWAVKAGGSATDDAQSVKVDPSGALFVTGGFQGTATFGSSTVITATNSNNDFYIAKYDPSGNFLWVQRGGGKGNDYGRDIGVDAGGNAYVIGFISDTATFGGITIFDNNSGNIFLTKYTGNGTVVWAKDEGGALFDLSGGISTDHLGGSYITGFITGSANFSGVVLAGSNDAVIAKYDFAGNVRWATKIGNNGGEETGAAILADSNGFCTVAGNFYSDITIGTVTLTTAPGDFGMYLAELGGGTVGINENEVAPFSIYPNPVSDILYLNLEKIQDLRFSIDVLAIDGKLVYSELVSHEQTRSTYEVDLSDLPNGNYLVRISSSMGDFTKPVVVNH